VRARTDPHLVPFDKASVAAARGGGLSGIAEMLLEPMALIATLFFAAMITERGIAVHYLVLALIVCAITLQGSSRSFFPIQRWRANIVINWAVLFLTLLFCLWVTHQLDRFSTVALFIWAILAPAAQIGGTLLLRSAFPRLANGPKRCVVVCVNPQSILLARRHAEDPLNEIRLVGFFDDRPRERLPDCGEIPLLGRFADIPEFVRKNHIHAVYISLPIANKARTMALVDELRNTTASI